MLSSSVFRRLNGPRHCEFIVEQLCRGTDRLKGTRLERRVWVAVTRSTAGLPGGPCRGIKTAARLEQYTRLQVATTLFLALTKGSYVPQLSRTPWPRVGERISEKIRSFQVSENRSSRGYRQRSWRHGGSSVVASATSAAARSADIRGGVEVRGSLPSTSGRRCAIRDGTRMAFVSRAADGGHT